MLGHLHLRNACPPVNPPLTRRETQPVLTSRKQTDSRNTGLFHTLYFILHMLTHMRFYSIDAQEVKTQALVNTLATHTEEQAGTLS